MYNAPSLNQKLHSIMHKYVMKHIPPPPKKSVGLPLPSHFTKVKLISFSEKTPAPQSA